MLFRAVETEVIDTIFLDIGGVLLTNGWDRSMRRRAIEQFHLDEEEVMERHHLTFDTYETGKIDLDTYLARVIFYEPRAFTPDAFKAYMFAQSQPYQETYNFFHALGGCGGYRMSAISNEGRELAEYRIEKFRLHEFIGTFVISSFVHFRKPDEDIFRVALDVAQARPERSVYIEDRRMFATVAHGMGFNAIHHTDLETTRAALQEVGVELPSEQRQEAA